MKIISDTSRSMQFEKLTHEAYHKLSPHPALSQSAMHLD
jgi:hypothetical protein